MPFADRADVLGAEREVPGAAWLGTGVPSRRALAMLGALNLDDGPSLARLRAEAASSPGPSLDAQLRLSLLLLDFAARDGWASRGALLNRVGLLHERDLLEAQRVAAGGEGLV